MPISLYERLKILFHVFGLSCICGAILLELFVFSDILLYDKFIGVEGNMFILCTEISLSIFSIFYFLLLFKKFLVSIDKGGTHLEPS